MSELRTFEDLECWKACRELRRWVAKIVKRLPPEEKYRLVDELLRASRSTTANIAEGYGVFHYKESIHYCRRSRGSAYEVLEHMITAVDDGLLPEESLEECRQLVEPAVKLTNGYIRYLDKQKKAASVREDPASYCAEAPNPLMDDEFNPESTNHPINESPNSPPLPESTNQPINQSPNPSPLPESSNHPINESTK